MQQVISASIVTALLGVLFLTGCDRPPRESDGSDGRDDRRSAERDERRNRERERERERDRDRSEERRVETRNFPVGTFSRIDLRGAAEVQVTIEPTSSVQMTGTERALNSADVNVSGDTLDIDFAKGRRWFSDSARLKIAITTPTLVELESNGAGDFKLDGLTGGELELNFSGAHNVEATGTLAELKLEVEGAGNVNFRRVTVEDADVTVNGAGNVEIHVARALKAEVNGVGAIRYTGDPQKVDSKLHGLGTISRDRDSSNEETTDKEPVATSSQPQAVAPSN